MRQLPSWAARNRRTLKQAIQHALGSVTGLEVSLRHYRRPDKKNFLSLRAAVSPETWRRCIELEYGVFDPHTGVLHVLHDSGLYSCISATLWGLTDLIAEGHLPLSIDFSRTLSAYKDIPGEDVYPRLFQAPGNNDVTERLAHRLREEPAGLERFDAHGRYQSFALETLGALIEHYLRPCADLVARTEFIRHQFIKNDRRYVGVCYRGTDKGTEVMPTDSSVYLDLTERLLDEGRAERVLIQTDQEQVGALFQKYFRGRCDAIDLLPRTRGQVAIHKGHEVAGSRLDYTMNMISAVTLLAEMEQVIVYTGNIGAWVPLMRGSCRGVWQATGQGILKQWQETETA